jgi:hypothetical protein
MISHNLATNSIGREAGTVDLRVSLLISKGYDEIRGFGGMEQFLLCPHATFSGKAATQYWPTQS